MSNRNVLSERYATPTINGLFSPEGIVLTEREFWIAVMKGQKELGINIPGEDIGKFERAKNDINLDRIKEIEKGTDTQKGTKHDVKARVQAFVEVSGAGEYAHLGCTSKDPTDNTEQCIFRDASRVIRGKHVSALRHLIEKAKEYRHIILTGRTHHQAAQPTLLGRRFSMWAEELMEHLKPFDEFVENYPLRGLKGAVGTQSDMLKLLGSEEKVDQLEQIITKHLGFTRVLSSPGQIYMRSLDLALASHLVNLSAAYESFAKTMRLMTGFDLVTEGFEEGQVGSSAMPHKMNTPHSERVNGLGYVLKGYQDMLSRISGDQWEEGDVSDSVVRRVAIPDMFYAADGQLEAVLNISNEMGTYPKVIEKELKDYLPFLATGNILAVAVSKGMGREEAHKVIKKHAVAEALRRRNTGETPKVLERLAVDELFSQRGITSDILSETVTNLTDLLGSASRQISKVSKDAQYLTEKYNGDAAYEPLPII